MDYSKYPRNDVLCIDMRSFYASVEAVRLGYHPMKVMLAVVGDVNNPGSIVLASSPALKKQYGLSNVNRYYEIPKDPRIKVVQARMGDYINKSAELTRYFYNFAPSEAVHPYSIDETWITINGTEHLFGSRQETAKKIQKGIWDTFGLPASIGIGDNKFLAKAVMDLYSKKAGIAECKYEDVEEKLWPVDIEKIWGIGHRMKHNLNQLGIRTMGHLAHYKLRYLRKHFGVIGEQLYWHAWGIDLSLVLGDFQKPENKGFGHGITLLRDYSGKEIGTCILELCEEVCRRARTAKKAGKTVHLSIGYTRGASGGFSRSKSVDIPTNITLEIYQICMQLLKEFHQEGCFIRRVYVTLTNLFDEADLQLDLFTDRTKKQDIGPVMDKIRDKFGPTSILRASSFTEAGTALDRSKKIGGHYA